jgi:type I restriction enzyme S subunit
MKYRLGDICSITKGETGIMKAIPGAYTMVTLGEANKTHNEFQFDTKAVIVPLVSSTGHGHASMRRVKYQEGKFALGSILCAVIPKDEKIVLAKYLHIYLHWNREELLVSKMKGMANVSLPMNKIADVLVTVPNIEKQQEIIDLEVQLVEKELSAENLLTDQLTQLENLNLAILQEAVQGKLVKQDPKDEPASELLKRIKVDKTKSDKKDKSLLPIKPEEIPFEIPKNWVWCRLGEIIEYTSNLDIQKHLSPDTIINYVDIDAIDNHNFIIKEAKKKTVRELSTRARRVLKPNFIVYSTVRPYLKNIAVIEDDLENYIGSTGFNVFRTLYVELKYAFYYLLTPYVNNSFKNLMVGFNSPSITNDQFEKSLFPLPPLSEQKRIVEEIEKQLAKIKHLKENIIDNQKATEQLLKALLHQAFEV